MPEEIHSTLPPPAPKPPDNWFIDGLKKQSIAVSCAAIFAFYTFVWNSHDSDKDLKYKVDNLAVAVEKLAANNKELSDTQNNFLIAITKISEAQNRMATDIKDIQDQQRRNTEALLNRK